MIQAPAPVAPADRIEALDILRAFALLGILVMNLPAMYAVHWSLQTPEMRWPAWYDRAALWAMSCFFSGKFNSLFSFLFGVGFTIQMERLETKTGDAAGVYGRRLLLLFVFGVLHATLIWSGDVLHVYAILGAILLLVRRVSDRTLRGLIVAALLFPTAYSAYRLAAATPEGLAADKARIERLHDETEQAYMHGTYADTVRARIADVTRGWYGSPRIVLAYDLFLATFLLGLYAGRNRHIQRADDRFVRSVQRWSFGVGLGCALIFSVIQPRLEPLKPSLLGMVAMTAFSWQRPALMLFYAATILRLVRSQRWGGWLRELRFAGRMPLTNYIAQSVIGTMIFYPYGLGFFNRCGPAAGLALAFAIFPLQVLWSRWWFARFQFGPLEWVWRSLTYGTASVHASAVAQPA